jgi:hypothetical protein
LIVDVTIDAARMFPALKEDVCIKDADTTPELIEEV